MITDPVTDAIQQVRQLKARILDSERFTGYSGRVRAATGTMALVAAWIMSRPSYPQTLSAHLVGWLVVMSVAVLATYAALFHWFLFNPEVKRDFRRLLPTTDAFPPLAVGAAITVALVLRAEFDLLFGAWMCLYGLANLSTRRSLPRLVWPLGIFYVACGAACLVLPWISFTNPWPMGIVFFLGEWAGGLIFHHNREPSAPVSSFFLNGGTSHERGADPSVSRPSPDLP